MAGAVIDRRALIGGAGALLVASAARGQPLNAPVTSAAGGFAGTLEDGIRVFRGIRYGTADRFRPRGRSPRPAKFAQRPNSGRSPRNRAIATAPSPRTACSSTSGPPTRTRRHADR